MLISHFFAAHTTLVPMAYCTNCSQPRDSSEALICPHCDARYDPITPTLDRPTWAPGCLTYVLMLVAWVGTGVMAIGSVLPYGGSSGWLVVWILLTWLLILAAGIWIVRKVIAIFTN